MPVEVRVASEADFAALIRLNQWFKISMPSCTQVISSRRSINLR